MVVLYPNWIVFNSYFILYIFQYNFLIGGSYGSCGVLYQILIYSIIYINIEILKMKILKY